MEKERKKSSILQMTFIRWHWLMLNVNNFSEFRMCASPKAIPKSSKHTRAPAQCSIAENSPGAILKIKFNTLVSVENVSKIDSAENMCTIWVCLCSVWSSKHIIYFCVFWSHVDNNNVKQNMKRFSVEYYMCAAICIYNDDINPYRVYL